MKVLLINPSQKIAYGSSDPPTYPPLGIGYIGAMLEQINCKVHILDMDAEKMDLKDFKEFLIKNKPDLIGITCTTPLFNQAIKLSEISKTIFPKVPLVLGGIHPTVSYKECIKSKFVDFVIFGEGEETIVELVKMLKKEKKDFSKIDGLVYKKDNKFYFNKKRGLIKNLDSLPFPARHLFNQKNYTYPGARHHPAIPLITSRGCPGQCTYCCTKQICGLTYRFRSAQNILDEIQYLVDKFGAREIHIWDDNFTVNKERVYEFCREFKKRGLKVALSIPQGLRADQVDEDIFRALKEVGVYSVGFGVESGNQTILDNVKKNIKLEDIENAFRLAKKFKFETWGFFIIGLPGDTKETVRDTINFSKKLDPDFAKFLILKPFPGSEIFEQLSKEGLIFDYNYDNYGVYTKPVHNLKDLTAEEVLKLQKKAFKEFYLRPKKIMQHLIKMRSPTQLKLNLKSAFFILKNMF